MLEALLVVLINSIKTLPIGLRIRLGRWGGSLLAFIPTRERKIARMQIQYCLGHETANRVLVDMYSNLGQTALECINLKPLLNQLEDKLESENWELIDTAAKSEKPTIVLSAHTGNWDLMAAYAVIRGIKICTIGRAARLDSLQKILIEIRETYGVETLWRNQGSSAKELIRALKHNKVVAALIDQDTNVTSTFSPFFGTPAKSPSGLIALAKRMEANILIALNFRITETKYKIFIHELNSKDSIEKILNDYNKTLERYIRKYPAQWVWLHKRWRTIEEGKTLSSTEYIDHLSKLLAA